MKKLVTTGFRGRYAAQMGIWGVLLCMGSLQMNGQNCVMSCPPMNPPLEVSLPFPCTDELTYDELGVTIQDCPGEIIVELFENGNSIGNIITADMIGNTYMVSVSNPATNQFCMFTITIVDKQAPIVNCPDDVTLDCTTDLDEYNDLEPEDISDCSSTEVLIDDQLVFSGVCQGQIITQYIRTYTIVDAYQNIATCEQIISLEKASLGDVEFPADLTGLDALPCFPAPDVSPEQTGYPSIDGNNITNGTFCNINAGSSDVIVPICSGSYKIMRSWTVMDWCFNSQLPVHIQVIEVLDQTPPVVEAPADMTISTSAQTCTANFLAPAASISDDCSSLGNVWMNTPVGTIQSNGGQINGLPLGVHQIIYYTITDCGLQGSDVMTVTVQDLQPPTPVCQQNLVIPLNNEGITILPAYIFNAASADNCSSVFFKVKRMSLPVGYTCANPGNPNNQFDDFVQFCCEDIANNNIMIILRIYDTPPVAGPVADDYLTGHFNDCMIEVELQDKLPPQIVCPSDLTISCEFPYTLDNLSIFGEVVLAESDRNQICIDDPGVPGNPGLQCLGLDGLATDNCNVVVTSSASEDIDMCGTGTITRVFTATDDGGLTQTCTQTISVINYDLFTEDQILWPQDFTTTDFCDISLLDPEDLALPFSFPVLLDGPCDLAAATHVDDVFDFSSHDQACFKILRTWTVIDWCQMNGGNSGTWTHIQTIKVMNSEAPVIEPIDDISECSYDVNCGGLELEFEASATDDCSGPASLRWRYFIDLDNNASFEFSSAVLEGADIAFTYDMPIGNHRILYTVWDQCGNSSVEEQLVEVESCKGPSAKCIHGLSANLMPMDMDGDGQPDWGMVTLEAEMFDGGSDQACGNPFTFSFSSDPLDVTNVFDCGNLGENEIELWVIDQNGLSDFCVTTLDVQDNNNICPPGLGGGMGNISGSINVPASGKLAGAMVYLDGSQHNGIPSTAEGYFAFPAMPFGNSYTVRPVKDGDDKNGVTTLDLVKIQKHLLGIEAFSSPFEYIAADANNSENVTAVDILQIRKLILGQESEFPNNSSWRFVDEAHVFPDPNNPWVSVWPELYHITPFENSMNDVNFNAVKIGDVNRTASLSLHGASVLPRNGAQAIVEYEVSAENEDGMQKVDLYLSQAEMYQALQFSFDWSHTEYDVVDWSPSAWLDKSDIRIPDAGSKTFSVATFTLGQWPAGRMPLMTIWLRPTSGSVYPMSLYMKTSPTPGLAYLQSGEEERSVALRQTQSPGKIAENRPNPFKDATTVYVESERDEKAQLRIFNLSGKVVHTRTVLLGKGQNEFIIHKSDLKMAGVYVYEIESSFQYYTNRMILVD